MNPTLATAEVAEALEGRLKFNDGLESGLSH